MKSVTVGPNDAGQRLDKYLTKIFVNLPASMMYKGIRTKDIKRNGKRCHIDDRVEAGDVITLYVKDEFLEQKPTAWDFLYAAKQLDVVYEDENLLLLNKPVGLLVHPDEKEYRDTLLYRMQRYLYEKGQYHPEDENAFAPALVNRIDRNTCGLVMAAKNATALRILNRKLRDREIHKFYRCIVHGQMERPEATLEGFLTKNEAQNRVYIDREAGAQSRRIATRYRVIAERDGLSLLEIELLTGRTHQIRAHLASIGHPLLGDGKYGTNKQNQNTGFHRQALCSYRLRFDFVTPAEELDYLNGKEFRLTDIWFEEAFYSGECRPKS